MDETKMVCVKEEPMRAILDWATKEGFAGLRDEVATMLAAAPTTHVAVKRELLERLSSGIYSDDFTAAQVELRALLSQKGE